MKANDYRFKTRWRLKATTAEVAEITQSPEELARWWSSVWLEARLSSGKPGQAGAEFECRVKGWLPYTIRFRGRVEQVRYAERFRVVTWGGFEGFMECTMRQEGDYCNIAFEWQVRVQKAIVRYFSWLFKGIFWTNHIWVMQKGLKSIQVELARRRRLAAQPGPEQPWNKTTEPASR